MAITYDLLARLSDGTSQVASTISASSGGQVEIDEDIPAEASDLPIAFAMVRAKTQMFFMCADSTLVVQTNSGAGDTFNLLANTPIVWYAGIGFALSALLTADITNLQASNASENPVRLQIRALVDPT